MSAVRRPARWLVVAAMAAAPVALGAQSLAAGDTLQLRLLVPVRSERTPDSAVRALVIAPVMRDGRVLVPPGAVVTGRVAGAGVEKSGSKHHWLSLDFDQAAIPLGGPAPADTSRVQIATRVVAVDNAREEVDSTGRILGPPIPALVRSKRNWTVVALGAFSPVGAVVLAAALEAENAERHRAVAFDAGTELRAVVTRDSPPLDEMAGVGATTGARRRRASRLGADLRAPPGELRCRRVAGRRGGAGVPRLGRRGPRRVRRRRLVAGDEDDAAH